MKKILFTLAFCVACLSAGFAQTAASSASIDTLPRSGDSLVPATTPIIDTLTIENFNTFRFEDDASLYYFMRKSTIPLPEEIRNLALTGNVDAALSKLEDYKKTLKTKEPLLFLLLDADFYENLRYDPTHGKTYQALVQKLKSEYGDRAEVIRFELDEMGAFIPEKVIAITDRMIKADPKYLPAYFIQGREFYNMGQTDKFCEDFDKLPEAVRLNDANYKRTCKK